MFNILCCSLKIFLRYIEQNSVTNRINFLERRSKQRKQILFLMKANYFGWAFSKYSFTEGELRRVINYWKWFCNCFKYNSFKTIWLYISLELDNKIMNVMFSFINHFIFILVNFYHCYVYFDSIWIKIKSFLI